MGLRQEQSRRAACRLARASGKSVVAIKLGLSEAGRNAALAHTGSLAGTVEAFDAIAGEAGVIRAETLDDAVEITELLVHTGAPTGRRLGAVTLSGAFRGMLLDAAERYGLEFQPLAPETTERLNAVLEAAGFDGYAEELCERFYAGKVGRPSLPPSVYFRLLLVGYFEGIDSERGIAWRVADSLTLREFLGYELSQAPPDHSTISRNRRLIDLESHQAAFGWVLVASTLLSMVDRASALLRMR